MIDILKPVGVAGKEVRKELDRAEIQNLLNTGNLYEIRAKLPMNLSLRDFDDFMRHQGTRFHELVQAFDFKAQGAAYHAPVKEVFPIQHQGTQVAPEEMAFFTQEMMKSAERSEFKFKAMKATEGSKGIGGDEQPLSVDEIQQMGEGTLSEWQTFMDETWMTILDAQMMKDYQQRMAEVQQEARRIIALVKSGVIGPEFALIAMAKVNQTKNGCLMTWLGKKAFHVNDSINKIAEDLKKGGGWDPANLQMAQAKTRDGAFQLNLLVTDMQKIMQDSAGVLEQVHGIMGEMNRTRREIITKVSAH